jgi:hypothetical protein
MISINPEEHFSASLRQEVRRMVAFTRLIEGGDPSPDEYQIGFSMPWYVIDTTRSSGQWIADCRLIGWRFLVRDANKKPVATANLTAQPSGIPPTVEIDGPAVAATLAKALWGQGVQLGEPVTVAYISSPRLYVSAVWAKSRDEERFITTQKGRADRGTVSKLTPDEFTKLVRELAQPSRGPKGHSDPHRP